MGRAAAHSLAMEGVNVTLVARNETTLSETSKAISDEAGVKVDYFIADLSERSDIDALTRDHPVPDILVTTAGIPQRPTPFRDLTRDDWNRWFDAHFHSSNDLIHAYAPGMSDRGFGRIVAISANFIKFPQAGVGPSHAARLALAGAIAALTREVAAQNVTINSILPGLIDTPALRAALTERADATGIPYEEVEAGVRKRCAADRLASAEEIGDMITMLCAAQTGYMTGQNVVVDGGAYQGLF